MLASRTSGGVIKLFDLSNSVLVSQKRKEVSAGPHARQDEDPADPSPLGGATLMSKSPAIRVSVEVSCKLTKVFRIPPHWTPWILLLIGLALTRGLGHLPVHPAA
jgi:hypothetical protein